MELQFKCSRCSLKISGIDVGMKCPRCRGDLVLQENTQANMNYPQRIIPDPSLRGFQGHIMPYDMGRGVQNYAGTPAGEGFGMRNTTRREATRKLVSIPDLQSMARQFWESRTAVNYDSSRNAFALRLRYSGSPIPAISCPGSCTSAWLPQFEGEHRKNAGIIH
jgi:DNA-directed RNA polymerase subunit RPC12/RpoP